VERDEEEKEKEKGKRKKEKGKRRCRCEGKFPEEERITFGERKAGRRRHSVLSCCVSYSSPLPRFIEQTILC